MKTIKLGFLGLGNIGSGVARVLAMNKTLLQEESGLTFEIVKVLERDPSRLEALGLAPSLRTEKIEEVTDHPDIDIIIEVLGGQEPAASFMRRALEHGKTVVTANKSALAPTWETLDRAAKQSGAGLYFEASAGGGIPVIDVLNHSMQANHIATIMGIINGTTNYMLWRMKQEHMSYDQALKEAQELGYAEPDPTFDVGGKDAAFKLSILASLAMRKHVDVEDIACVGITEITPQDLELGGEMGMTMKLLGIAKDQGDEVEAHVYPTFLPDSHMMSAVTDAFNAIFLTGDMVDDVMLYGRGAGALPTASAIVSDIVRASKAQHHEYQRFFTEGNKAKVNNRKAASRYFLRFDGEDIQNLKAALEEKGLKVMKTATASGQCAVLIDQVSEEELDRALAGCTGCLAAIHAEV